MNDRQRDIPGWGFGEVIQLSVPASMSGLNRVATQFVDGYMISHLGTATVSGQAMGGLVAFMLESFARGVLSVVNTFVSQNLGAGRARRCGQYTWAALMLVCLFAVVLCPLALAAGPLFALLGHEAEVQRMEVIYFRYMILSAPIALAIRALEGFFYGVHRPGIVFKVSLLASLLNVFGNWLLIYGKFGLPALGLHGAAIASVISWLVQMVVLAWLFLSDRFHKRFGTRYPAAARARHCRQILRIGVPSGGSFFIDIATWTFFMTVLVGHFGKLHMAAASHAMRYMRMSFIPAIGIGIAATVLVGRYIGQRQRDLARKRAYAALITGMVYMGLCGLAFVLFRKPMMGLFVNMKNSAYTAAEAAQIIAIGSRILLCMAVFQLADAVNIILSGALRGAGDTRWPMWATAVSSIAILVCGGLVVVKVWPELGSLGPFSAAAANCIVLAAALAVRFESGQWRKIDLLAGKPAAAVGPGPAPVAPPTVITVDEPTDSQQEN